MAQIQGQPSTHAGQAAPAATTSELREKPSPGQPSAHTGQATPAAITSDLHGTIQIVQSGSSEHLYSFLSTLAWVILIFIVVAYFRKQIRSFLVNVNKRLAAGASIKTPWFELEGVSSQTVAEQTQKLQAEVEEVAQQGQPAFAGVAFGIEGLKTLYLTAEDLALREIQAEFRAPLSRQITTGGQNFDGVFAVGEIAYLIEVKLVRNAKSEAVATRSANQLVSAISRIGWKNARGLLAIVYDAPDIDLQFEQQKLRSAARDMPIVIEVRAYALSQLAEKYRVRLPNRQ